MESPLLPLARTRIGRDDPQGPTGSAKSEAAQLSSGDKTVRIYPEAFHEPRNDLDYATVVADVVGWIEARGSV